MIHTDLSPEQWAEFDEQGYVRLGKTMTDDELAGLRDRIDAIMLGTAPIDLSKLYMQLDSDDGQYGSLSGGGSGPVEKSLNYRKIQNLEFDPLFKAFMEKPIFQAICARCYGEGEPVSSFRAMFMNKPAHKGTLLPWHQDAWLHLDRQPIVTLWTALDPATVANGCVEVVPGTHKLGLINKTHGSGFLNDDEIAQYCTNVPTVFVEVKEGESALLHNWLMHRSDVNKTDIPRRAFSVCYADGRTRTVKGEALTPVDWGVAVAA